MFCSSQQKNGAKSSSFRHRFKKVQRQDSAGELFRAIERRIAEDAAHGKPTAPLHLTTASTELNFQILDIEPPTIYRDDESRDDLASIELSHNPPELRQTLSRVSNTHDAEDQYNENEDLDRDRNPSQLNTSTQRSQSRLSLMREKKTSFSYS
jgi:hypothetical protein